RSGAGDETGELAMNGATNPHWRSALARDACALMLAMTFVLTTGSLGAQEVESIPDPTRTVTLGGIVTDQTGRPLNGAEVMAGQGRFALSGSDGRFLVTGVPPGTGNILVRRVGYRPASIGMEIEPGGRVGFAGAMSPLVVELGTIVIEGKRMDLHLWRNGFYTRQTRGLGTFFGPEYVSQFGGTMASLLRGVPTVEVDRSALGQETFYGRVGGRTCEMLLFLDGTLVRGASSFGGLDAMVTKQDILGMEVYPRSEEVPPTLSRTSVNDDCGAIVVWTKRWRNS